MKILEWIYKIKEKYKQRKEEEKELLERIEYLKYKPHYINYSDETIINDIDTYRAIIMLNHKRLWSWISKEIRKNKETNVFKRDYFFTYDNEYIPQNKCYACEYCNRVNKINNQTDNNCVNCPIKWGSVKKENRNVNNFCIYTKLYRKYYRTSNWIKASYYAWKISQLPIYRKNKGKIKC